MKRSFAACCYFALTLLLVSCGGGGGGVFIAPAGSTPPTVNATTPANGATAVPITTAAISATFDRAMDGSTVSSATFVVKDSANNPVPGTVTLSGATATFAPSSVLAASTVYTATITTGAKDMAGTALAGNYSWSFTTTSDATRPTVISTVPVNTATNVPATTTALTINFSEAMDPTSITPATIMVKDNSGNPLAGTVTLTTATAATFTPAGYLAYSATYTITVTTGVRNQAGNTMAATYTGTFATLPGFGSWLPTATTNAPTMSGHTAVWTGTEMIVFNGTGGSRYNPANGTWTPIADFTIVPGVLPRVAHSAVWTGTQMIIWGGYDPVTHAAVNTGAAFTPGAAGTAGTWFELSGNPPTILPRYGHTAVWDSVNAQMIVWGGFDPSTGTYFNDGAAIRPGNNWTTINTPTLSARRNHGAVWTGSQMIVWGGVNQAGAFLSDGAIWDAASSTWLPTTISASGAPAPATAGPFNAVWTGTDMLIWGGAGLSGRYNLAGNNWFPITTNSSTPPVVGTAVWTGSLMVVWGNGIGGRYNPTLDTWTAVASAGAPSPRNGHSAVWTGTGMIIFGGVGAPGSTILNDGGMYTP